MEKIQITDRESAYSSMCILPDGNIGLYYEEEPGGYSMVYVPVELDKTLDGVTYGDLPFRCNTCKKGLQPQTIVQLIDEFE
ncbi:MAG: exo-alpha-sialidase [Bacteroidaceae bacterium]|nr:exo-alpha-sialidase [Bacteroidaceae bacterium]